MIKSLNDIKNILKLIIPSAILVGSMSSCEEDFFPDLEEAPALIVVDAWINDKPETQTVRLTYTQPYFDAVTPTGVQNATVYILDEDNNQFDFIENGTEGTYEWTPSIAQPQIGEIDKGYNLIIDAAGETFTASSFMNRVPAMDSVTFRLEEENNFFPESFFAEFYARDFVGVGDTYWIKAWKNGSFLNKPNEINIAFDAGFSAGGNIDGSYFIQPIRDGINPFETDENDEFISPYSPGDSVYVEIHSITYDAFIYMNELQIQTDRPGGFAELFSVPLSNIPTNISNVDPTGNNALGFFSLSAVSSGGDMLDPNNLPQ
jgi:hypothetical protein